MLLRPPRSTRTDTLFLYTTLFRSSVQGIHGVAGPRLRSGHREEFDMRYRLDVVAPTVAEVVRNAGGWLVDRAMAGWDVTVLRSEEHKSELQSLMRISYAVFCLKKKK